MSWSSPGPEDCRGSPERSSAGASNIDDRIEPRFPGQEDCRGSPERSSAGTSNIDDRIESRFQQFRPANIQPNSHILHNITPRDEGEPIASGRSDSPHQSRLIGYTAAFTGHSPSQSYPAGQLMHSFLQSYSTPVILIDSQYESSPFSSIGQQTHASLGLSQWSTSQSQISSRPSSQGSSPRHGSQVWSAPLGPPQMTYTQVAHLQRRRTQSSCPSVSAQPPNSYDDRSPYASIGLRSHASLDSPQRPTSQSQNPCLPSSRGNYLQHDHQARSNHLIPSQMSYTRVDHPQRPWSQSSLPSVTTLSLDDSNICTVTRDTSVRQSQSPVISPTSDQSMASDTQDNQNPVPQNLRGDPFRSAKVKTELCRFFNSSKGCVFGDKCNYAHGEHELKFNKLADLEVAGLVDVEIFRTHVCFTWVATGACPFDQRCTRLHDPRVTGIQPAWLPHAEVLVSSTKNGHEVDNLYHQQYSSLYSCSPIYGFAPKKKWKLDKTSTNMAWKELYAFCCNLDLNQLPQGSSWQVAENTEMHRLAMVLMMRKSQKARQYEYLPSHNFCGELCMVLQTSYFVLEVIESFHEIKRYQVVEISEGEAKGDGVIIAREIAFGPVADASVRPVSTWFNIKPEDIARCTRQQARRHKRSRHRIRAKRNLESHTEEAIIADSFPIPPFTCHQPVDDAAFDLITGIQLHRYRVLKYFSSGPDKQEHQSLAWEEERLQKSFESQRRFWMTWTWPKRIGSCQVDDNTEVPIVNGTYNFVTYGDPGYGEDAIFFGSDQQDINSDLHVVSKQAKLATGFVWKSFVMNLQLLSAHGAVDLPRDEVMSTHESIFPSIHRIPTLRDLSLEQPANRDSSRVIPMLTPQLCTSPIVITTLDVLIQDWKLIQRQYEDNSSYHLTEATQGKDDPSDSAQLMPKSYS